MVLDRLGPLQLDNQLYRYREEHVILEFINTKGHSLCETEQRPNFLVFLRERKY